MGFLLGTLLWMALEPIFQIYLRTSIRGLDMPDTQRLHFARLFITLICCYICVSTLIQTKEEFRFIIPYVEFSKQLKGAKPLLLDTSVIIDGRVVTNDYNINKICQLQGVEVINLNELANALKVVALPGEALPIKIVKQGDQIGQGVGYLDDGTMVVVEQGRSAIGQEVSITVTSVLQTPPGRMNFGKIEDETRIKRSNNIIVGVRGFSGGQLIQCLHPASS